jgi:hypothetical protein
VPDKLSHLMDIKGIALAGRCFLIARELPTCVLLPVAVHLGAISPLTLRTWVAASMDGG